MFLNERHDRFLVRHGDKQAVDGSIVRDVLHEARQVFWLQMTNLDLGAHTERSEKRLQQGRGAHRGHRRTDHDVALVCGRRGQCHLK